jgi:hypothetical protein
VVNHVANILLIPDALNPKPWSFILFPDYNINLTSLVYTNDHNIIVEILFPDPGYRPSLFMQYNGHPCGHYSWLYDNIVQYCEILIWRCYCSWNCWVYQSSLRRSAQIFTPTIYNFYHLCAGLWSFLVPCTLPSLSPPKKNRNQS